MFDQLSELVKQFGSEAVVNNPAVPNEQNDAVMQEAGGSILSGLKDMVASGNINDLTGILSGKTPIDGNNPVVQQLTEKVTGNLGEKFGLSERQIENVFQRFIKAEKKMLLLIDQSFLSEANKINYKDLLMQRINLFK